MGTAAFSYLDFSRYELLFPDDTADAGRRYGILADNALMDFGTDDFAVEILFSWDSDIANQANIKLLVGKGNYSTGLNNNAGYNIYFTPSTKVLSVQFNDGNAALISWSYVYTFNAATGYFIRLEFDRSVGCSLYVNGVFVSTDTTLPTRPNSISNAVALYIGGYPGQATSYLKGSIGLLRFDAGYTAKADPSGSGYFWKYTSAVSYGDVWNYETYLKYKHFWPETIGHYRAAWYFNNSLIDSSYEAFTFLFKDGTGAGATATYNNTLLVYDSFTMTFDPQPSGHEWGPIDMDSRQRALDGTMKISKGAFKQHKAWKFFTTDIEQIIAILGAYYTSSPIQFHEISTQPFSFVGFLNQAPVITEMSRIGTVTSLTNLRRKWLVDMVMEEM